MQWILGRVVNTQVRCSDFIRATKSTCSVDDTHDEHDEEHHQFDSTEAVVQDDASPSPEAVHEAAECDDADCQTTYRIVVWDSDTSSPKNADGKHQCVTRRRSKNNGRDTIEAGCQEFW